MNRASWRRLSRTFALPGLSASLCIWLASNAATGNPSRSKMCFLWRRSFLAARSKRSNLHKSPNLLAIVRVAQTTLVLIQLPGRAFRNASHGWRPSKLVLIKTSPRWQFSACLVGRLRSRFGARAVIRDPVKFRRRPNGSTYLALIVGGAARTAFEKSRSKRVWRQRATRTRGSPRKSFQRLWRREIGSNHCRRYHAFSQFGVSGQSDGKHYGTVGSGSGA